MDDQTNEPRATSSLWKPAQTYTMAAVCLLIGLVIGYFLRGSAIQQVTAVASEAAPQMGQGSQDPHAGMGQQQKMPSLDDMKRMADKQTAPLLEQLKKDPNNADLLNQVGTMYRATHQFKTAIDYYQKSLAIDPKNVGARTDLASCLYYLGDVDGALAQLNKSLTYDPKHAGTLMNIGIIKWKGKNDVNGAVAAWEKLLKLNPDFENKEAVQHLIEQAKQGNKAPTITGVQG
ncbi:MAG: tetratricopeptide repeat protein [Candidatus Korobacteraceae bacterium]